MGVDGEIMQAKNDDISNQAEPDVPKQVQTETNCIESSLPVNAARTAMGQRNSDYSRDAGHRTKVNAEVKAESAAGTAPDNVVAGCSETATRMVEDESKHRVVAEDNSESVARRVRSRQNDKAAEKYGREGADDGSPRSSPGKKRRSPSRDDVVSPTKKKRVEGVGISTESDR